MDFLAGTGDIWILTFTSMVWMTWFPILKATSIFILGRGVELPQLPPLHEVDHVEDNVDEFQAEEEKNEMAELSD